ncbi:MAG: methylated-DNA--[protein]-cysteine S-methyltransferase [Solirubrobacterales bacterium]|nr:methylated-DNA--[protein]-cysteine S-methyltransferase [Solirubrobacterales bacterium]HRV59104.1 methylated-DNA--[protein]-cysteine S-methyltransferase [Solirubrobacterales bacterium]
MNELEERLTAEETFAGDAGWEVLRSGLLERADREELIDLAYERHETPFGRLLVVAGDGGIVRIALDAEREEEVLDVLASRISPRIGLVGRDSLAAARHQLDRYFEGELTEFDLTLDWRLSRGFRRQVLHETAAIPYGSTASYAQMAARAGSPRAVRAAGSALATNPLPIVVPCHRVLRSDGRVGAYLGGTSMKEALLAMERDRSPV